MIWRFGVNVPFWDEWDLAPLVEKSFQGTLTFRDFIGHWNEHWPVFMRLILLPLIRLTSWDMRSEWTLNLLLAAGIFIVFLWQIKRTFNRLGLEVPAGLVFGLSLSIFSLHQAFNWIMGFQMIMFLQVFSAVTGLFLLAQPTFRWRNFAAAWCLGWVATLTTANGLLFWPVGWWVLRLHSVWWSPKLSVCRWFWMITGLVLGAASLYFYRKPGHHPTPMFILQEPGSFFAYVGSLVGHSVLFFLPAYSWVGGLLAGMGTVIMLWFFFRSTEEDRLLLLPYAAVLVYFLGAAFSIAIGRSGFGYQQSLSDRYVTFTLPIWISLLFLLYWIRARYNRPLLLVGISSLLLLIGASSARGYFSFLRWHQQLEPARAELFLMKDESRLKQLYPDLKKLRKQVAILKHRRLSVFRQPQASIVP
jgi:hypothetical protein